MHLQSHVALTPDLYKALSTGLKQMFTYIHTWMHARAKLCVEIQQILMEHI